MKHSDQPESKSAPGAADTSRRTFVKSSAAAVLATSALNLDVARAAYAASTETLKVGLIGCGGRGTGAAAQALRADPNTELVAMADVFPDHMEKSYRTLMGSDVASRVKVPEDHRHVGFDAYEKLLQADVDIVLLATPPQFRPMHLKACIDAGKHTFVEKPVAVDATGIRSVIDSCKQAREKNLSVVSGLCWRYETNMIETIDRLQSGAIGDIQTMHTTRYSGGVSKQFPRTPGMKDMEWQLRNWYYLTWLSCDFFCEQFVHEVDNCVWALGDIDPVSCSGTGGRQTRLGEENGNIYDHFSVVFEFPQGQKMFASTRHQRGCTNANTVYATGTKGRSDVRRYEITGENPWRLKARRTNMHQLEHDAMYAALRRGEVIDNSDYMIRSTLMGIMARETCYTGKTLTWEQMLNSKQDLSPPAWDWDIELPLPPVAMPGVTPFV